MLEFGWISSMHRDSCPVDMQFPHDAATAVSSPDEFWPEGPFVRTLPQTQKPNKNVLFRVLI